MIDWLRSSVSRLSGPGAIRECRLCGTVVEGEGRGCPECGSGEIARYEL